MPLPIPVERQREVVYLGALGHQVVLGTAGSGKTTMAVLRAAFLSDAENPSSGPTLLLTFNKALASYIRTIAGSEFPNLRVENYHKFARGYLASRGKMRGNSIAGLSQRSRAIELAIEGVKEKYGASPIFARPINFFIAEVVWLAQHGVHSLDDYRAHDRIGRAEARLERSLRHVMWEIYQEYLRCRSALGYLYDFDDLASAVSSELDADTECRLYKHIVIDEGQDFSPEMIRSIAKAVPQGGSVTFFGDVAQQIYGHRMSWRSAGLNPQKVWHFAENYRNSREIARLGLAISRMPYYAGVPDMVAPAAPIAAGPKPTLVKIANSGREIAFVVDQAVRAAAGQSVAVLARTVRQLDDIIASLPRGTSRINLRDDRAKWVAEPRLYLGTIHSAKGLEFDAVFLPFMSASEYPDPNWVSDFGQNDADASDGRLLYVGVTRARTSLIVSYAGEPTHLLPLDDNLYTKVNA